MPASSLARVCGSIVVAMSARPSHRRLVKINGITAEDRQ
jgi:hypothetical protein